MSVVVGILMILDGVGFSALTAVGIAGRPRTLPDRAVVAMSAALSFGLIVGGWLLTTGAA